MDPFQRVLAEPGSLAARKALAAHWKAQGDPRAELIENQVAAVEYIQTGRIGTPLYTTADRAANVAIRKHGKEWAGELAPYLTEYSYKRGLVAQIRVPGEQFRQLAAKLFSLAPIQHLDLVAPLGPLDVVFATPELARLTSLAIIHQKDFGDAAAEALARSKYLTNVRWLDLESNAIDRAGVDALAASPYLASAVFVELRDNPADPTPFARELYEGHWEAGRPALAAELEATFGPRPWLTVPADPEHWPPGRDDLAMTP